MRNERALRKEERFPQHMTDNFRIRSCQALVWVPVAQENVNGRRPLGGHRRKTGQKYLVTGSLRGLSCDAVLWFALGIIAVTFNLLVMLSRGVAFTASHAGSWSCRIQHIMKLSAIERH